MYQQYSCPHCGVQVAYGVPQCHYCGGPLLWQTQQYTPPQLNYQQRTFVRNDKQKSSRGLVFVFVVGIVLLIVVGVCIFGGSPKTASSVQPQTAPAPAVTSVPSTPPTAPGYYYVFNLSFTFRHSYDS